MNAGGLIVVLLGAIIMIVGIRGTQNNVFPWFFNSTTKGVPGSSGSSGGGSSSAM